MRLKLSFQINDIFYLIMINEQLDEQLRHMMTDECRGGHFNTRVCANWIRIAKSIAHIFGHGSSLGESEP